MGIIQWHYSLRQGPADIILYYICTVGQIPAVLFYRATGAGDITISDYIADGSYEAYVYAGHDLQLTIIPY